MLDEIIQDLNVGNSDSDLHEAVRRGMLVVGV